MIEQDTDEDQSECILAFYGNSEIECNNSIQLDEETGYKTLYDLFERCNKFYAEILPENENDTIMESHVVIDNPVKLICSNTIF